MEITPITALKPMYLETPLDARGEAVSAVLVPDQPGYRELGDRLAQAMSGALGAAPRVCSALAEVDPTRETVIALGQMINNQLIERLYWNRYLYVDALCPGGDGFVVQTVHDPYPWRGGHNVVVLGGSTLEGVGRAVNCFVEMLPAARATGALGYTLKVRLPAERETGYVLGSNKLYTSVTIPGHDLTPAQAEALSAAAPQASLLTFLDFAMKCLVTGEAPYLEAGKRELEAVTEVYEREPGRLPPWTEETNSFAILTAWDAVEEAPVFSAEERLRYTNTFLRYLLSLVGQCHGYATVKHATVLHNHQTFALLGLYAGGRYFHHYYDYPATEVFLSKAAAGFAHQAASWKPLCDTDFYLTLPTGHTISTSWPRGSCRSSSRGTSGAMPTTSSGSATTAAGLRASATPASVETPISPTTVSPMPSGTPGILATSAI